jgi:hypothetical protein
MALAIFTVEMAAAVVLMAGGGLPGRGELRGDPGEFLWIKLVKYKVNTDMKPTVPVCTVEYGTE